MTALPQVFDECVTPTTTTTILSTPPFGIKCNQACYLPTSVCSAGEPTGPVTTATLTASDLCTVTLSVGSPFLCGGCASCTSATLITPTPAPIPITTVVANPGGPMMTARQLAIDVPILDHNPGGPVAGFSSILDGLTSILTIAKRDDKITEGHGGGLITMTTETPSSSSG